MAALLLNVWFIITLGAGFSLHHATHITSYCWAPVAAWAGGTALWIALTFLAWLVRRREDRSQPIAEIPG